ncbi:MAG: 3'(2'),5'-bisphosphate nucleotidase CysQ [Alphaproteobacteria bacterium]|nr:MAG: 3'(2'),5'-bisphosphate nucleotidase CysQ [Alphaproteobacteria bacterium]
MKPDLKSLLPGVERIAREAGAEIMKFYEAGARSYTKADESPVTDADYASEKIILPQLSGLFDVPIVSEEAVSSGYKPDISKGTFWTVDPLDGTQEFIDRTGAFVVAISLVVDNKPVLGVIYHPALGIMYSAAGPGTAMKTGPDGEQFPLGVTGEAPEQMRLLLSEARADMPKVKGYLSQKFNDVAAKIDSTPGVLRACQVADNMADMSFICPTRREGRTKWWDVAPGQAIVEAAGGKVEGLDGSEIVYDATDLQVPPLVNISPNRAAKPKSP